MTDFAFVAIYSATRCLSNVFLAGRCPKATQDGAAPGVIPARRGIDLNPLESVCRRAFLTLFL